MSDVKRYDIEMEPSDGYHDPYWERVASENGEFVLASDYDALKAKVIQLLYADASGIVMSSSKDGVWNYMQEMKAMVNWQHPADGADGK